MRARLGDPLNPFAALVLMMHLVDHLLLLVQLSLQLRDGVRDRRLLRVSVLWAALPCPTSRVRASQVGCEDGVAWTLLPAPPLPLLLRGSAGMIPLHTCCAMYRVVVTSIGTSAWSMVAVLSVMTSSRGTMFRWTSPLLRSVVMLMLHLGPPSPPWRSR